MELLLSMGEEEIKSVDEVHHPWVCKCKENSSCWHWFDGQGDSVGLYTAKSPWTASFSSLVRVVAVVWLGMVSLWQSTGSAAVVENIVASSQSHKIIKVFSCYSTPSPVTIIITITITITITEMCRPPSSPRPPPQRPLPP